MSSEDTQLQWTEEGDLDLCLSDGYYPENLLAWINCKDHRLHTTALGRKWPFSLTLDDPRLNEMKMTYRLLTGHEVPHDFPSKN